MAGLFGYSAGSRMLLATLVTLAAVGLFGSAAGCSREGIGSRGEQGAACAARTENARGGSAVHPLKLRFPEHSAEVLERREAFVAVEDGFSSAAPPPNENGVWARVDTLIPATSTDPIRLRAPGGFEVHVRELGATGPTSIAGSAVTYGRQGGRSFWSAGHGGPEEWLWLDPGQALAGHVAATWEVEGGTLVQDGESVGIEDAEGVVRIHVTAPVAYALGGRQVDVMLGVNGGKLELFVDGGGEEVLVDPTWSASASMVQPRTGHTANLLSNGNVFVFGGLDGAGTLLSSVGIYTPAAGTWSVSNSNAQGRYLHTGTSLPGDRILVAGGLGAAGALNDASVYTYSSNSWSSAPLMHVGRSRHAAALLTNGSTVLVTGGITDQSHVTSSVEAYDSQSNVWANVASMNVARYDHTVSLLTSGETLVVGGAAGGYLASTEKRSQGTWTVVGALVTARASHTATVLQNGKVLVAGGLTTNDSYLSSAELFDPASSTWSPAGLMTKARAYHTATLLPSGRVLVAGGSDGADVSEADIYDPTSNSWSASAPMNPGRREHTATLLATGEVLVAGGRVGNAVTSSTQLFTLDANAASCAKDTDCASGFCTDGVCCATACAGGTSDCQACNVPGSLGTCTPVPDGASCSDANACTAGDTCQAGVCAAGTPKSCMAGSVAVGASHTVALRSDGTVWAWGYNGDGQLGVGSPGTELEFAL